MQAAITRLVLQREGDPQSRAAYTHGYRHGLDREIDPAPYWQQIRRAGLDRLGGFQSSPARISTINKVHLAILGCWMLLLDRATNHIDMPFIIEESRLLKRLAKKLETSSDGDIIYSDIDTRRNMVAEPSDPQFDL